MSAFRVEIDGRAWEGEYSSFANAVFGACRADENAVSKTAGKASDWRYGHMDVCKVRQGGLKSTGDWMVAEWQCDCGAYESRRKDVSRAVNDYHAQTEHKIRVQEIASTSPKKIHRIH